MDYPSGRSYPDSRSPSINLSYTSSPRRSPYTSTSRHSTPRSSEVPSIKYFAALAENEKQYISPYSQDSKDDSDQAYSQRQRRSATSLTTSARIPSSRGAVSTSSSSSQGSSAYSGSGGRKYKVATSSMMSSSSGSRPMSTTERNEMLRSLKTHRVNTLTELRRIERLFVKSTESEVTEAMTTAWAHYVNSNNLLSELRGLTKNYPFSSECLDEAKWQVIGDPASTRSWNYCWLILTKIKNESLIKKHARQLAAKPTMWGGRNPTSANVEKLANACIDEWTRALSQMLRQWDSPPSTSGQ